MRGKVVNLSKKELFIQKMERNKADANEALLSIQEKQDTYRTGMFNLGKSIEKWVQGTDLEIECIDKKYNDETTTNSYPIRYITIRNGEKFITIEPIGCIHYFPRNFGAKITLNPRNIELGRIHMDDEGKWELLMPESMHRDNKRAIFTPFDQNLFFDKIDPIA